MADSPSFDAINKTWTIVQNAFPDALASASPAQRQAVIDTRNQARDAYYAALNKLFDQSDAQVAQLTSDLSNYITQMNSDLNALKDVSAFLNLVASAVKTATTLAKFAA